MFLLPLNIQVNIQPRLNKQDTDKKKFMKKMYETRLIRITKLWMCKTCQRFIIQILGFK